MKFVRSDLHLRHDPRGEIHGGELVEPFESPARWRHIVDALELAGGFDAVDPHDVPGAVLERVHDGGYIEFLRTAWSDWKRAGYRGDMIPTCFPSRRMRQALPTDIDGRLGYYAFAAETSITAGTWDAALGSASLAYTAQQIVAAGESGAFALCRPPGHHASRDQFGGYCFVNNAAVAAQAFIDDGCDRVGVLDIDFHHGNGTQDIFYDRADVLFASLHGDPAHEFPHFSGFADETGSGAGTGCNANYPLAPGTDFATWGRALDEACAFVSDRSEALVVSLGVDTFVDDPISSFTLTTPDFLVVGRRIGELGLPTVFCMEGGYAVAAIGTNTVNVLLGFEAAA